MLDEKKISSESLVKFYYQRSKTVGRKLEAVTESNIETALIMAIEADREIAEGCDRTKRPILGVPFSVKESIAMKGFDSTQGYPSRIGKPEDKNAYIVDALIEAGGIPFMRTNVPQGLMTFESVNEIFGNSKNPHQTTRTSGGSSGGEASLIASGCSPFGMGSDIGGSVRIPSLFSGLFGFKHTTGRLSFNGHPPITPIDENKE